MIGTSDPYVIFKLVGSTGKSGTWKSETKKKTLQPIWNEESFISGSQGDDCLASFMKCTSQLYSLQPHNAPAVAELDSLEVRVMDWDRFSSDDYMGSQIVNISGLRLDEPQDFTVDLAVGAPLQSMTLSLRKVTYGRHIYSSSSQDLQRKGLPGDSLGSISFTLTKQYMSKKKKKAESGDMHLVTVDLIAGREFPSMDDDGRPNVRLAEQSSG